MKNSVESALFENIQKRIKNESFEFTGIINKSLEEVFQDDITYLSQQKKILDKIRKKQNKIEENEGNEIIDSDEENNNKEEENVDFEESEYEKNNYYENFTLFISQKLDEVYQILKNNYTQKRENRILMQRLQNSLQQIKQFYEKFTTEESIILAKRITDKQNEIDFRRKSKLSQIGYQWNKICKEEIDSKYKETAYKELFKLSFAIFNQGSLFNFKKYVQDLFDEIMKKKEITALLLNKGKKCMNNIVDDIKIEIEEDKKENNKKENNNKNLKQEQKKKEEDKKNEEEEEEEEKSEGAVEGINDI